jgi:hypothetical protein
LIELLHELGGAEAVEERRVPSSESKPCLPIALEIGAKVSKGEMTW